MPSMHVTGIPAAELPIVTRQHPCWLVSAEGTTFNPPMLIEGADLTDNLYVTGDQWVGLSVWPAQPRPHRMYGLILDLDTRVNITITRPEPV